MWAVPVAPWRKKEKQKAFAVFLLLSIDLLLVGKSLAS